MAIPKNLKPIIFNQPEAVEVSTGGLPDLHKEPGTTSTWNVSELESFFAEIELPTEPVLLKPAETITDIQKFISSHLFTIKANNGNSCFLPYLERLQLLKSILTNSIAA